MNLLPNLCSQIHNLCRAEAPTHDAMQSSTSHERTRDELSGEEDSHEPSSSRLIRNIQRFNDERPLSQQGHPAPSPMTECSWSGEGPHACPETAMLWPTPVTSLQFTFSDRPHSVIPMHCDEGVGQSTFSHCSNGFTLASDSEGSTEPDGPLLPSRTTIQRDIPWYLVWFFDILLTIIPLLFLGMVVSRFLRYQD